MTDGVDKARQCVGVDFARQSPERGPSSRCFGPASETLREIGERVVYVENYREYGKIFDWDREGGNKR